MSCSQVDTLSSREAQTLKSHPAENDITHQQFLRRLQWIEDLRTARDQPDCAAFKALLSQDDFFRTGVFGASRSEQRLLVLVRRKRWEEILLQWDEIQIPWVSQQLAMDSVEELLRFISTAPTGQPETSVKVNLEEQMIEVERFENERVGKELEAMCEKLMNGMENYYKRALNVGPSHECESSGDLDE